MANPLYGSNKFDNLAATVIGDPGSADGGTFNFDDLPIVGDHGGVDTASSVHLYNNGLKLYVQNIGTQTAGTAAPAGNAIGIDYSYDGANNEGVQWALADASCKGVVSGSRIQKYTVGSDAFFAKRTFKITDVSDTDDLHFGFRKVEAFQAAVDDYDEAAGIGIVTGGGSSDGLQKVCTILNGGSTSETTTTESLSDGAIVSWGVKVAASGATTFEIDGAAPDATASFTFDQGEVVTPYMYALHGTASSMGLILMQLEHGRQ